MLFFLSRIIIKTGKNIFLRMYSHGSLKSFIAFDERVDFRGTLKRKSGKKNRRMWLCAIARRLTTTEEGTSG